ncbi:zinc finger CCCH-type with G patch domain-containing protein [Amia ocellicauda]|uniref:zinc finger CCCH-type with G patch domain-containing protein n=1 Tax=Amia ocellicauda TaxID=2972642 RepID=UPI003463C669|nr:ZGPAT protein [Amia calva]
MDEGSLEAAIETYNAQLQQVDTALGAGLDPSQHSDLLKLKEDLHQLIELTESSLVSVKKSRLLASLEEGLTSPAEPSGEATQASLDDEFAAFYASVGGPSCGEPSASDNTAFSQGSSPSPAQASEEEEDEEGQEEIDDEMSGMKVCAPYRTSWGTLEYHNAMVVGAEASDCVRVLYVHPTHKSMKPCPYFLEDKCRFVDRCRFSHGEVVSVSELRQFEDSDLSSFQEGSACLARHEDGIWYPATITDIDSGYYTVKFNSALLKEAVVEADGIIPPLRKEHPSSSESEDDDMVEYSAYAKVVDSMSTESEDWAAPCSSSFGGWEQHTRGIGSKLMAKMGYEFGKGLGRNAEGRVEPVLAVVLPKGKSLDQCADILQKKRLGKLGKDRPGNSRKKGKWRSGPSKTRTDVFDFLNSQLGGERQGDSAEAGAPAETNSKETYRGGKTAKRSLNVKLYQASGKVAQTEREINSITKSLSRNMGRDKAMTSHLEERLSAARKQLVVLKEQEVSIQRERRKADTHKKMTEF